MNADRVVDIAVVGAGLVGTPLALMLSKHDLSVALVDKQSPNDNAALESRGFTALSHATVQILKQHDLWQRASADACAIKQVHVSHKGYFGATRVSCQQLHVDALGHVVDNAHFISSIQSALATSKLQHISGAEVTQVEYAEHQATLHYKCNGHSSTVAARLIVAVDGVSSFVRQSAGIQTTQTDYSQVGVLGTIELGEPHNGIAYERFTSTGPLALLPRPGNKASFVYCINPEQQDSVHAMSDDEFMAQLQREFGFRLGRFQSIGARTLVPLLRIEATAANAPRLLLLGNALRLLHPVAGQGYNLAMRDAQALFEHVRGDVADPGNIELLEAFVASRRKDHQSVVRLTDTLARTFRGSASIPAHIRALGLLGLDHVPPLRNAFTKRSMGYTG